MFRTALRNVLAHKARLLMTVLAVMLGVAFVSGTLVFTDTFGNAYKNKSAKSFDHVSVAIQPEGGSYYESGDDGEAKKPPRLTDALLKKTQNLPGADSAIGGVMDFTRARRQGRQARRRRLGHFRCQLLPRQGRQGPPLRLHRGRGTQVRR
ncbi:hypothetical protein QFZ24_004218 [Streptomyces phaeochromogenes]|nr:hypothetical protein [Streptomyces phaeochromogenes]